MMAGLGWGRLGGEVEEEGQHCAADWGRCPTGREAGHFVSLVMFGFDFCYKTI